MMIGLLLESQRKNDATWATSNAKYGRETGSYHKFRGDSGIHKYNSLGERPNEWQGYHNCNDAIVVYDQASFLPLGLAVAK